MRRPLATLALSSLLTFVMLAEANAEALHIRGEITALNQASIEVLTKTGQTVTAHPHEQTLTLVYAPLAAEDLKVGAYVGVPSVAASDDSRIARSIVVFPEDLRGFNEGDFPWDLEPESRMTNATLARFVDQQDGKLMTVTYGDYKALIELNDDTPLVTFSIDPNYDLSVGDKAILFARSDENGIVIDYIGVSEDGSIPPL